MISEKKTFLTNLKPGLIGLLLASFLVFTNIFKFDSFLYSFFDRTFIPVVTSGREATLNLKLLLSEVSQKELVLRENIEIKRELLKYKQLEVNYNEMSSQLVKLQEQVGITIDSNLSFELSEVFGVQNLFAQNPRISLDKGWINNVQIDQPVYFDLGTILGFVTKVSERTSEFVPVYSEELSFKVSVANLKEPNQKALLRANLEKNMIVMDNLPVNYDIDIGDIWITTNDVDKVPSGLIVGSVKQIEKNEIDGYQKVYLELPYSISQLTYVFIEK